MKRKQRKVAAVPARSKYGMFMSVLSLLLFFAIIAVLAFDKPAPAQSPQFTQGIDIRMFDRNVRTGAMSIPGYSIDGFDKPVALSPVESPALDLSRHYFDKSIALN